MKKDPEAWLQEVFEAGAMDKVAEAMRFESIVMRERRTQEAHIREIAADTFNRRTALGVPAASETPNADAGVGYGKYARAMQALWDTIGKHSGKESMVNHVARDDDMGSVVRTLAGSVDVSFESIAQATRHPLFQAFRADVVHLKALSADLSALDTLNEVVSRAIAREERYEAALAENAAVRDAETAAWNEHNHGDADIGSNDLDSALRKAGFSE